AVSGLRPSDAQRTSCPAATSAAPSADPISPGCKRPTTATAPVCQAAEDHLSARTMSRCQAWLRVVGHRIAQPCGYLPAGAMSRCQAWLRVCRTARLGGKNDLGARAAVGPQLERALQLVANESADDREARAVASAADARPRVGDREHDVAVPPRELDPHVVAT